MQTKPNENVKITGLSWCKCPDDHKGPHIETCPERTEELVEGLKQAWACIEHIRQWAATPMQKAAKETMNEIQELILRYSTIESGEK